MTLMVQVPGRRCSFNADRTLRWSLEQEWAADPPACFNPPRVCFIGHNPASADEVLTDGTVRRWLYFARAWGYGGMVAVNAYPFRHVDPQECRNWLTRPGAEESVSMNVQEIAMAAATAALIVVCWGAILRDLAHAERIVEAIRRLEPTAPLHCFKQTKSGAPYHLAARGRHRIPDTAMPALWREAPPLVP